VPETHYYAIVTSGSDQPDIQSDLAKRGRIELTHFGPEKYLRMARFGAQSISGSPTLEIQA
jgi:hypothetical protein